METISAKDFDEGYCQAIDDVLGTLREEDRENSRFRYPLEVIGKIKELKNPMSLMRKRMEAEKTK